MTKPSGRDGRSHGGPRKGRPRKRVLPQKRKKEVRATSASAKKIKLNSTLEIEEDVKKHYRIIDFLLVFSTIATLVKCKTCDGSISFDSCKKEGLGFKIKVSCEKCKTPNYVPSSERIDGNAYEINYRFAFVMRVLGLGLAGCEKFCGMMDMASSFIAKPNYLNFMKKMNTSVKTVANKYFASAVKEEKAATCKENKRKDTDEITVSGDGTWKKRGFTSLFGVSSLIGHWTGKIVDIFVNSAYCHLCEMKNKILGPSEYEEWHEGHVKRGECDSNHTGPSGNMEVSAIVKMFQRSVEFFKVKYRNYIGDGDSKTYTGVVNAKPYGDDFTINKKECIGHVQKRMGKRLRDLVKSSVIDTTTSKGKKVKRKTLSGKGKLTGHMIDKLTVYYGLAIRRNHDSVDKMKNAIWATFFHYSSTDEKPQHEKCDVSWCEWKQAEAAKALSTFKHSYSALPDDVLAAMKPLYEDLSKDSLLERCLGGFTQNNNESYNQLIWKISPKSVSGTSNVVEIAAYVAACVFNEGSCSLLNFMQELGIATGPSAHEWARATDSLRISKADEKAARETKESRILRRQEQKDALDILDGSEQLYGAGIDQDT